jgi:hypothetical protein
MNKHQGPISKLQRGSKLQRRWNGSRVLWDLQVGATGGVRVWNPEPFRRLGPRQILRKIEL